MLTPNIALHSYATPVAGLATVRRHVMKVNRTKMKAWLITWDWAGDAAAVADEVVGVLNPRWAERRVADIVEFLYSNTSANISELAHYAKRPSNNPYRAEIRNGRIHCGHNPFLYARIVTDLKIAIGSDGKESITW
jgi:hypothetical protein